MNMLPSVIDAKTPLEKVAVYLQLASAIGTATISGTPTFASDPVGLVFTAAGTTDALRTATALVSGGVEGTEYTLTALCTISTGEIVQPSVILPVITPTRETQRSRPVIL